jgi:two-component system response regulator YesN
VKLRLLIADDEELARIALRKMIRAVCDDFEEILEAERGTEVVEIARRMRPHLTLIDIRMPGLNGLDAAAQLKAINPEACIIVVSALDRFSLAQRAVNLGLDGYLLKPVIEEELRHVLAASLARIERTSRKVRAPTAPAQGETGLLPPSERLCLEEHVIRSLLSGHLHSPAQTAEELSAAWEREERDREGVRERLISFAYALEREARRYPDSRRGPLQPTEHGGTARRLATGDPRGLLEELLLDWMAPSSVESGEPSLRIREYLSETAANRMTLDDLAERLHLSPSYTSRLFKEVMGRSFATYVSDLRMERALALLLETESMTVEELARHVGYSDPAYFSRLFKERTGLSPRDYARSRKGGDGS